MQERLGQISILFTHLVTKEGKMEKYFNTVSMLFGLVGGVITGILGGWDVLTHQLLYWS